MGEYQLTDESVRMVISELPAMEVHASKLKELTNELARPAAAREHIKVRSPEQRANGEKDPHGKAAHEPGAKLDAGKVRPALVMRGFARALLEVSKVGTYGAVKYSENGWTQVEGGISRYDDAAMRHWLKEAKGETIDPESELLHAAHEAWNALARLDLMLREIEQ